MVFTFILRVKAFLGQEQIYLSILKLIFTQNIIIM